MNKKILSPVLFALFLLASCGGKGGNSLTPVTPGSSNSGPAPTSQPTSQPASEQSSEPASEQTSQPTSQPASEQSSEAASEQSSDPGSDPSSEPGSVPTSDPSSEPSGQRTEYLFEAEYCPCIGEMEGATYSGGTSTYGLIGKDRDNAGASGGYYVHFMYVQGSRLVFNIQSDRDVDDVKFVARFSAEYRDIDFNVGIFPILINGIGFDYGTISIKNVPLNGDGTKDFADFVLLEQFDLQEGMNSIEFCVENNILMFGTALSTAPMIDCIKLTTSAVLTWPEEARDNLDYLG